ncbi:hypothetical protein ACLB2K_032250 [Fragaria x ananassa]
MAMGRTSIMLLILTLCACLLPTAHPLVSEVKVLAVFKNSLQDPNNVLQSWDPTVPGLNNPCGWVGVQCNTQYKVQTVNLIYNKLSGQLVPELGLLSDLEYLLLYGNMITGTIPAELGNLKQLYQINLRQNKLSGKIPSSVANLPMLHSADFSDNGALCWEFQPAPPKFMGDYPLC